MGSIPIRHPNFTYSKNLIQFNMFHYVYQVTNVLSQKIYVGKHSTENLDDGYMGSGKLITLAINKYGIENFQKQILKFFESESEALQFEAELVTENFLKRSDVYNINLGGRGGFWAANLDTDEMRIARSKAAKIANFNRWNGPGSFEAKKKQGIRSTAMNLRLHAEGKMRPPNTTGYRHSVETKRKIGNANSKRQSGSNNSQFDTMWIVNYDLRKSQKIKRCDLEDWTTLGWRPGRKMNF